MESVLINVGDVTLVKPLTVAQLVKKLTKFHTN